MIINKISNKIKHYICRLGLLRYESIIVKGGEKSTSTSDNDWYIRSVESFLRYDKKFKKFKRSSAYREVLEHVTQDQALQYIGEIKETSPEMLSSNSLKSASMNDVVGSPIIFDFDKYGSYSGPTMRYLYVCAHIKALFEIDKIENIAEIGGGYGGQALVYNQMFKYNAYTIFDLEPVCRLVDKYLGNFYLTGGIRALDINKFPLGEKKFDLVISNYAFSELPKKLQEIYLNKVILNSKCGYMTMNTGYDLKGFRRESRYNCSELLDMLPNSRVIEEKPLTGKKNYIIAWGE
jgi:putative sugar O-methyltransferase